MLALMHVAWPSATITENTAPVWAEMLVGVDPVDGLAASKALMRSSKWFPALSEYIEAVQSATRIRTGNVEGITPQNSRAVAELDAVPLSRQEQLANVAEVQRQMRHLIAIGKTQAHWHGGPNSCTACGGLTTDPKTLARYADGRREPAPFVPTGAPDDGWIEDAKSAGRKLQ